jgi:hypothetical protein
VCTEVNPLSGKRPNACAAIHKNTAAEDNSDMRAVRSGMSLMMESESTLSCWSSAAFSLTARNCFFNFPAAALTCARASLLSVNRSASSVAIQCEPFTALWDPTQAWLGPQGLQRNAVYEVAEAVKR